MKICFFAPPGKLSESIRQSVRQVFASSFTDISDAPFSTWREMIANCDALLVDATAGMSKTCFLTGLAKGLGKQTIILTPVHEAIAEFLTQNAMAITHQWNLEYLKQELEKIAHPSGAPEAVADDTPAGKFRQHFGDLLKAHGYVHRGPVEFDGSTFTVREQDMDFALVQEIAHRAKSLNLRVRLL
jgi:hypothetical protein